ncbi:hypothetical protein [Desulfosarcina cetonica]|uniref:hypothetical protein n=1 Tax=Desulfosarcina cetonica TaxID=90730 RepID=UPI0006D15E99|nr:hypothetical protein [Desulfosarcina cetonica]
MIITFWLPMTLVLFLAGLEFYRYGRQYRQTQSLRNELLETREELHRREAVHSLNQTHWEQTEEKLRCFLELMDTLINTIANRSISRMGRVSTRGATRYLPSKSSA